MSPLTHDDILARRTVVRAELLARSKHVRSENFPAITAADLRILFDALDRVFFDGELERLLHAGADGGACKLRFSKRLTSSGGRTTRRTITDQSGTRPDKTKTHAYEITISSRLLFENFKPGQRPVMSCGVACATRLDALERVMEHELLHLYEFLLFGNSRCAAKRFQTMARNRFGHASHQHTLVTPREIKAALLAASVARGTTPRIARPTAPPRVGTRVRFAHGSKTLEGVVTRVTRRATVIVEQRGGLLRRVRQLKFYVPVHLLAMVT